MPQYEPRFQEPVQRLDQETARLREDFERRSAATETLLDENIYRLGMLVRQETSDRGQSLDDLESRLQQAAGRA